MEKREITYNLLKAQREFLEIPHDYNIDVACYQGGYGSGKTFCGSLLGILLCLKFAGIRGLVGAKTYTLVRDTTLKTYFEHLDNMGFIEGKDYEWSASLQQLKFKNKSEILFRHFDDPNSLKSLNLGFVEIEEIIIVVVMYLIQQRIVVTPEQLEKKHREILDDVENKFATLNSVKDLKEQMGDMKEKIDRIYECIIAVK